MSERPDIDAAVARMKTKMGAGREIKQLPTYLWDGEVVEALAAGSYGNGLGLLVQTNLRLLFIKDGVMSKSSEDFPYSKISSVQWSSGMGSGTLIIFASGNKAEIKNVYKDTGKAITDSVRARIAGAAAPATAAPYQAGPPQFQAAPPVAAGPPPGWMQAATDPPGVQRWWTGQGWSEHTQQAAQ